MQHGCKPDNDDAVVEVDVEKVASAPPKIRGSMWSVMKSPLVVSEEKDTRLHGLHFPHLLRHFCTLPTLSHS